MAEEEEKEEVIHTRYGDIPKSDYYAGVRLTAEDAASAEEPATVAETETTRDSDSDREEVIHTLYGDVPKSEFYDVVRTPSGTVTREEYDALKEEYPEGVPASAVEEVVSSRPEVVSTASETMEELKEQAILPTITSLSGMTPEQQEVYQNLTPQEQFDLAVKTGDIPEGSVMAEGGGYYTPEQVQQIYDQVAQWEELGYITPQTATSLRDMSIESALNYMQSKSQELNEIQKANLVTAYGQLTDASIEDLKKFAEEIDEKGLEPAAQYVQQLYDKQIEELEEQISALPIELQEAYKTAGIKGYNEAVERYNVDIKAQQAAFAALNLDDYRVPIIPEGADAVTGAVQYGYDLVSYFRDNGSPTDIELNNQIKAKLVEAGFDIKQVSIAIVQAFSTPGSEMGTVGEEEFEEERPGWLESKVMSFEQWQANLFRDLDVSVNEIPPTRRGVASGLAGVFKTGLVVATGLPLLISKVIISPADAPATVWGATKGMATHVAATATNLVTGQYYGDLQRGDASRLIYDSLMTTLIVHGGYRLGKPLVSKVVSYVHPKGIPPSLIVKEASTGRIRNIEGLTQKQAEVMLEAEKIAMQRGGAFTETLDIEGTPYNLTILKTPLQYKVGNILFHGTKTEIGKGGVVAKQSLLDIAKEGKVVTGEGGLYTSPYAAVAYTRGGQNPGLLMVITDASKIKTGSSAFTRGATESDAFIRGASEGFYGSNKLWRGDFEVEVVGARGTVVRTPTANTGLYVRLIAGDSADFFTYDAGSFIPVKVGYYSKGLSAGTLKMPTVAELYAAKLLAPLNALRDTYEAIKHPGAVLKDIAGTTKELLNLKRLIDREGTTGEFTLPGVRDIYLNTNRLAQLKALAADLWNKAFKKSQAEATAKGIAFDSDAFRSLMERNMKSVYESNANALLDAYMPVVEAYNTDPVIKQKFESSYIANLGLNIEAIAKASEFEQSAYNDVYTNATRELKEYSVTPPTSIKSQTEISRDTEPREISPIAMSSIESTSEASSFEPTMSEVIGREEPSEVVEEPFEAISERVTTERATTPPYTEPVESRMAEIEEPTERLPEREPREPIEEPEREPEEPIQVPFKEPVIPETPPIPPVIPDSGRRIRREKTKTPLPQGTITFKMGAFWKYLPPPWTDKKLSTLSPKSIPQYADTRGRTPSQTLQIIGTPSAKVPESISVDMGVVDVHIYDYGTQIEFGRGLGTNVGERIDSNTKGISIPAVWQKRRYIPVRNRVVRRKKPNRNRYADLVGLQGVRM